MNRRQRCGDEKQRRTCSRFPQDATVRDIRIRLNQFKKEELRWMLR